jgi:hypothetical protein
MKHAHGASGDKPADKIRRKRQPKIDRKNEEKNRGRARAGGEPNELGITQGQNGEQGNTVNPRNAPKMPYVEH